MNKIQIIIGLSIVGLVIIAYYFIGDVALGGLLALFLGKGKNKDRAHDLKVEADEHETMANNLVNEAIEYQQKTEELYDDMTKVTNEQVNESEPIQEVVDRAKQDRS